MQFEGLDKKKIVKYNLIEVDSVLTRNKLFCILLTRKFGFLKKPPRFDSWYTARL